MDPARLSGPARFRSAVLRGLVQEQVARRLAGGASAGPSWRSAGRGSGGRVGRATVDIRPVLFPRPGITSFERTTAHQTNNLHQQL